MNNNKMLKLEIVKNNLSEGQIVSYKELCNLLDLPYFNGKQKQYQLKDLKRYFDFENINRKIKITEIYDSVLPKEPKANVLYVKYIECILLSMLAQSPDNKIYRTNNELYYQLGMANNMFVKCYNNYKLLVGDDITYLDIRDFYDRCNKNLASILTSSFTSLKNRRLVDASKEYMIGIKNKDGIIEYHEAKDYERTEILRIERETMLSYGAETEFQIYQNHKQKKYFEDLDRIFKEEYNWDKVFRTNKIIYCRETAIKALSDDKIRLKRLMLNEAIVNKFYRQSEALYKKEKDNQDMIDLFFDDLNFEDIADEKYDAASLKEMTRERIDNDYAIQCFRKQCYLTDTLIKIN